MADLIPPRRDEFLTSKGVPTLRFSEYLEGLAQNVNAVVEEASESLFSEVSTQNAKISKLSSQVNDLDFGDVDLLNSKISRLESRINDLEMSDDTDVLNGRIAQVSAKVARLIEELLTAVKANAPDKEQESEKVILLINILEETKLLNARTEEAFETELTKEDL